MLENCLQLRVALGQGLLMLFIQLRARRAQRRIEGFQLATPLVQLDQHRDFAAQDLRDYGHCDVVDCTELITQSRPAANKVTTRSRSAYRLS